MLIFINDAQQLLIVVTIHFLATWLDRARDRMRRKSINGSGI